MLARTYHVRPYDDHFGFGWEMGRIARALVTGYGYSDPFRGHTGQQRGSLLPIADDCCGLQVVRYIYSTFSGMLIALNCVLNALTVRTTWEIAARCFNPRIAKLVGMDMGTLSGSNAVRRQMIWEMSLTNFYFPGCWS